MCWQRKDTCTPTHDSFLLADLVSFQYVSGSAYKIVNNRAYHHGTMLISTELHTLGDLLRTSKVWLVSFLLSTVAYSMCLIDYNGYKRRRIR